MTARPASLAERILAMLQAHEREAWDAWMEASRESNRVRLDSKSTVAQLDAAHLAVKVAHARLCETRKAINAALAEVSGANEAVSAAQ